MWQSIFDAKQKDYIITAACNSDEFNLKADHAYTLTSAIEFNDPSTNKPERLVQLRDPWGQENYSGPWNKEDKQKWTDDIKAKLKNDEGYFFMPFDLFKKTFNKYTVTMYDDKWKRNVKKGPDGAGKSFEYFFDNPSD